MQCTVRANVANPVPDFRPLSGPNRAEVPALYPAARWDLDWDPNRHLLKLKTKQKQDDYRTKFSYLLGTIGINLTGIRTMQSN